MKNKLKITFEHSINLLLKVVFVLKSNEITLRGSHHSGPMQSLCNFTCATLQLAMPAMSHGHQCWPAALYWQKYKKTQHWETCYNVGYRIRKINITLQSGNASPYTFVNFLTTLFEILTPNTTMEHSTTYRIAGKLGRQKIWRIARNRREN